MTAGPDGKASAVTFERTPEYAEADAAAGAYVLRTSHTDWDLDRVLRTYWRLTEIEATFRSLKSELGLRPIWHHKDERVSTHLFIAVLAYHGVHLIRTRLQARGHPAELAIDPRAPEHVGAHHHDRAAGERRPDRQPPGCASVSGSGGDLPGSRCRAAHSPRSQPCASLTGFAKCSANWP